jgi:predicted acylesterase/phospholipase RssA
MAKTALILAGGGSRGIIQLGMVQAFRDLGLKYDSLYGSSVGALNGLLVHQEDWDAAERLWMNIRSKDVYRWNLWNLDDPMTKAAIYDSKPLEELISKNINLTKLLSRQEKFIVNTTDIRNWKRDSKEIKDISAGDHIKYIKASASPPVLFPRVYLNGKELVDAGVMNNFSIGQAIKDDCDTLIIMYPTKPNPKPIRTIIDMVDQVIAAGSVGYFESELSTVEKINKMVMCGQSDKKIIKTVIITPHTVLDTGLIDFEYKGLDRKSLVKLGYELAKKELLCL